MFDGWHITCNLLLNFVMRLGMKDTFVGSNVPEKVRHFIFECEIFDKKNTVTQSRDIRIELAECERLSSVLSD